MNQIQELHVKTLVQYLESTELEEALDYLEKLPNQEKECWELQNIMGVICSYCGQFEEAIAFFRRALGYDPDLPDVYFNLADAYMNIGQLQQAELMLKSCESVTKDTQLLEGVTQIRERISTLYGKKETEKKENNVLMVAYYFPPLSGSGVFRSLKFAKYLPEMGWKTSVISATEPPRGWNFRDDSMVQEIPKEVEVVRIADEIGTKQSIELTTEQLAPMLNLLKNALETDKDAMNIFSSMLATKQGILHMATFPCASLGWAMEVVKHIEDNVDLSKLDVIYTTSGPLSSHLIGCYIKKKYGIPWVADYRDPWTDNAYGEFDFRNPMHKLLFLLERNLMRLADKNIILGEGFFDQYVNRFNIKLSQLACITNGYDEEDFINLKYSKRKTNKFTINYSGLIYTRQQSVFPVFVALRELCDEGKVDISKIKFRIVGEGKEEENRTIARKYGLENVLEQTGYVSHHEALQANVDADVLLLLIGDEERFKWVYTGKVFEYLRSGKEILALVPKDGYVDALLTLTGHGETFLSTQKEEIKNKILQEYQNWEEEGENIYKNSPFIKLRERKYLTMKLADVLYCIKKN